MALNQLTDLQPTNIKVTGIATFDQTVGIAGTLTYQDVTNVDAVGILTARSDINALGNIIGDNATNISGINSVTATTFYGAGGQTKLNISSNGALTEPLVIRNGGTGAGTNVGMIFYNGDESSSGAGALARIKAIDVGGYDSDLVFETGLKSGWGNTTTERLRISSSGKVNIGDNQTSQNILNIEDGTAASMEFASHGTGGDTAYIGVKKSTGGGLTFGISNRDIIFKTGASYSGGTAFDGGTERFRIDSGGRIFTGGDTQVLNSEPGSLHISGGGTAGSRVSIRGTATGAGNGLAEVFAFWDTNKVAGMIAFAGEDTTNKDDGKLNFYTADGGGVQARLKISKEGYVTKPSNAIFHAFGAPSDVGLNTDIVFGQERFDVGGGYNTSTGEYTAPATGYYHFYAQVYRQRTHDDSAWGFFVDTGSGYSQISEARMENDYGGDSGRGYATLQSSIYWYMTAGHKMKCRVTTSGNIHCNNTYSYFCGNLVG